MKLRAIKPKQLTDIHFKASFLPKWWIWVQYLVSFFLSQGNDLHKVNFLHQVFAKSVCSTGTGCVHLFYQWGQKKKNNLWAKRGLKALQSWELHQSDSFYTGQDKHSISVKSIVRLRGFIFSTWLSQIFWSLRGYPEIWWFEEKCLGSNLHVTPEPNLAELIERHICIWPTKSLFL